MKDFFTECLKDLYSITGIEQVRWMQNDLKDGKRNFDLCVDSMVKTCELFDYIPEDEQKKIIRRMMIEDKDYTGLNSRTVYKWLALFKDSYFRGQTHHVEIEHNPAPPEVADKYLKEWSESLSKIGTGENVTGIKDLRVQQMKDKLGTKECKHIDFIEDEKGKICIDCGKQFPPTITP